MGGVLIYEVVVKSHLVQIALLPPRVECASAYLLIIPVRAPSPTLRVTLYFICNPKNYT